MKFGRQSSQTLKKNSYCKSTICCIRCCEVIKDEPQRSETPEFESFIVKMSLWEIDASSPRLHSDDGVI